MKKNDNAENVFKHWLTENKEKLKINTYDINNRDDILSRWPGSQELYDTMHPEFTKLIQKKENRKPDEVDFYRFLLWTVSLHKQHQCGGSAGFEPIISPIKENHRTGAHIHMLIGSSYDVKTGLLRCGTLNK